MTRLRRFATAFGLALALVFAQHGAVVHALAHATDSLAQHKQLPPSHQCDQCASTASLSGALAPSLPVVAVLLADAVVATSRIDVPAAAPRVFFRSRAPPPLS